MSAQPDSSAPLSPAEDQDAQNLIPLSNAMVNIGFALAKHERPLHGYAIIKEVQGWWWRRNNLGAGSLYRSLPKMIENGMVIEVGSSDKFRATRREASKRFYELTDFGHKVLEAQLQRDEYLLEVARSWLSQSGLAPQTDENEQMGATNL